MTRKQKKMLYRILIALVLFAVLWFVPVTGRLRLVCYLVPYAVVGWDVLWRAVRNISHGQVFDENFLMAVATVGAFAGGEYPEGVAVMIFYQLGELFQGVAVGRSRRSISDLMDIRPDYANIQRDGELVQVDPDEVAVGDTIVVQPGERIPLDGVVLTGTSALDTAALTGESVPREVSPGDSVVSGCVNLSGVLTVEVSKVFGESTVARILELVENASSKKAKAENFITKFARWYTPAVVITALALAILPPLFVGSWGMWVHRALIFLVVSCPCALVISIPLSFFGGIGGAARQGILIKGGNYLEVMAETGVVVFDKTGTLTQGVFRVSRICPAEGTEETLLELAALVESYSNHPISQSLKSAWGKPLNSSRLSEVQEVAGHGVTALVDGHPVCAGNTRLMEREGISCPPCDEVGTVVHVAAEGRYLGYILISDQVKATAAEAISDLKSRGVKTVMLTGDSPSVADAVAAQLGMDEVHAGLLPGDKVDRVEQLLAEKPERSRLAFVGDGVNDAPVLSRADIGIAMGAMGSDAAIEAADIVLMDDDPAKVARAMDISRKCLRIVKENIAFSLGVKGVVLILSAIGLTNMWAAVFADVGVMILAVLNAGRMLRK